MALDAYLRIKGQNSGIVKGSATQKGRENKIIVIAASHEVIAPHDPQSGHRTGHHMHKPFIITKESDKSSPVLYNMLVNNENILEWDLQFWAPSFATGQEILTHTVKLVNAHITSINFCMPNSRNPELVRYAEYEEIAFTYQKIIWTWNDGRTKPTATDDWESNAV